MRGWAYAQTGDHARALADFDDALRLYANFPLAYYFRSWAYTKAGDRDRAGADRLMALKLDPELTRMDAGWRDRIGGR